VCSPAYISANVMSCGTIRAQKYGLVAGNNPEIVWLVQWLEDLEAYDVVPSQKEARSCSCWPAGCIIESVLHVTM